MTTSPSVTVIIPAYNEEDGIVDCLESILTSKYPDLEIIVVDDKSSDRTAQIASRYPVKLIKRETRGERCITRNDGIREAQGRFIAFVDADCTVKDDWLRVLISDFVDETIAGVGGVILTKKKGLLASYRNYAARENYGDKSEPSETLDLPGGNGCYRTAILRQVGGFDPAFGMHETFELGLRIRKRGSTLIGDPRSVVWHGHEDSLSKWFQAEYSTGYSAVSLLGLGKGVSRELLLPQLRQIGFIAFLVILLGTSAGFVPLSAALAIILAGLIFELIRAAWYVTEVTLHYKDPKYVIMFPVELLLRGTLYVGYVGGLCAKVLRWIAHIMGIR
jgi:glycosyltransferase involved in cell wall biosynthesis